jgi:Zn-dependent protease with chaperone function
MANLVVLAANMLPPWGTVLAQSLQDQMLQWVRCAEFSCDRAALLAIQDPKVVMSVLMKLAGGSPTLAPQLNLDAFIEQAKAYDSVGTDSLGEILQAAQTAQLTHPVPVIRAREIERWAGSVEYQSILDKRQLDTEKKLGWSNW